ncbi:MAG TPA: MFS transporter [Chloroflexia bacterium]|nr:MFS transporter [Chloroflexia bacterium]
MLARLKVGRAYLEIVRSPNYFPLWFGQLVSNFGDTLNYIALVVLIFRVAGQGVAVSGLVAFEVLPYILLGPIAGVILDRFSRKTVLVLADLIRAVLVTTLIFANQLWQIYLITTLLTCASVFFGPALNAAIPAIVPRSALLAANSVAWSTGRLVQIIAAATVGGLVSWAGTGWAFGFNAASFIVSALLIALAVKIPAHAGQVAATAKRGLKGFWNDTQAGFRYARRDFFVSRILVVQALASLAVGGTSALLVVLNEKHLKQPPAGFAALIGAIGFGALLGPLFLGYFTQNYRNIALVFMPYVIRGVGDVLIAVFTPLPVALVLMFIYGLNTSTGMVVYNSLMQSEIADEVRGRVFTLFDVVWNVMKLLSLGIAGVLADQFGVNVVYYLGGSLLLFAGLIGLRFFKDYQFKPPEISPVSQ